VVSISILVMPVMRDGAFAKSLAAAKTTSAGALTSCLTVQESGRGKAEKQENRKTAKKQKAKSQLVK